MKKGIYIVHFEFDNNNVYKIGSTKNLKKRLQQMKTFSSGEIELKKFYEVKTDNIKVEHILHHQLKDKRINTKKEFFEIENFDEVDVIVKEIIKIVDEGLFPSIKSTEEELRMFIIRILGGFDDSDLDKHLRFDFSTCNEEDELQVEKKIHNDYIISILKKWKVLPYTYDDEILTWKGAICFKFNLNTNYIFNFNYYDSDIDYYGFVDNEEYDTKLSKNNGQYMIYSHGGIGTIGFISFILKKLFLEPFYYKTTNKIKDIEEIIQDNSISFRFIDITIIDNLLPNYNTVKTLILKCNNRVLRYNLDNNNKPIINEFNCDIPWFYKDYVVNYINKHLENIKIVN